MTIIQMHLTRLQRMGILRRKTQNVKRNEKQEVKKLQVPFSLRVTFSALFLRLYRNRKTLCLPCDRDTLAAT